MKQRIHVSQKVIAWKNTTYVIEADTPQEAWQKIQAKQGSEEEQEAIIDISFDEALTQEQKDTIYVMDDRTGEELERRKG